MDGMIDHDPGSDGADLELLREALQAGLDAMRAVLTRGHEAQISTLRDELEQERLKTAEAHVQIAKLTVELGDAAAALQTEKHKLEALRRSTDVLRAQQRAAWDQFDGHAANATTRSTPGASIPTTNGESVDPGPFDDGVPDLAGATVVGLAGNKSASSQTEAANLIREAAASGRAADKEPRPPA